MAIAEVVTYAEDMPTGGGTTAAVDTTGCNFLLLAIASYGPNTAGTEAPSDSKGNTWNALTIQDNNSGGAIRFWYAANPTVGSGHTFTYSDATSFPVIGVLGFSGVASSPFDQQNGAIHSSGSPDQPGSVTPSEDNELIVTAMSIYGTWSAPAVDSSFSIRLGAIGTNPGMAVATKIQTTAGAENPSWSWTGSANQNAVAIATFKAAAAAAGHPAARRLFGRGLRPVEIGREGTFIA